MTKRYKIIFQCLETTQGIIKPCNVKHLERTQESYDIFILKRKTNIEEINYIQPQ